jgi:ATP-dependent Zn protease
MAIEDRSGSWRSEEVGSLITVLGAMAAELVFYGQNGNGVGGDLHMATTRAAYMVGGAGMAPAPIELEDRVADAAERERTADAVMERFETLGTKLLHRSGGMDDSYFGPAVRDAGKRKLIAALLGQSFVIAYATIRLNQQATERIAERLISETEIHGDDVTDLLDAARLRKPEIDVLDDTVWPVI